MYSDVFCKVYDEFGWNYYPEIFGQELLAWMGREGIRPRSSMDLACGTGVLCRLLHSQGIRASGMDFSEGMIQIARAYGPEISYEVADMITFRPERQYSLVTCTGDALNHIPDMEDVERIFRNVYAYTAPGGYFVFDVLNEHEVSTSEPFEMEHGDGQRVWFQMTRPAERRVELKIRVMEADRLCFEEVIRETIHDPATVCDALRRSGFRVVSCDDHLPGAEGHGTTWFVVAQKG